MCPVRVQSIATALIGLTSSTGLVGLAMTNRDSADAGMNETSDERTDEGESHDSNKTH